MLYQIIGNHIAQAAVLYIVLVVGVLGASKRVNIFENWHLKALRSFVLFFAPIWATLLLGNIFLLWHVAKTIYEKLGTSHEGPPWDALHFLKLGADPELIRWYVLAFVGLVTTLGGILGTPIALIRVFTTERQTKTAEESHITDQINKAVEGLGTNRLVKRIGRNVNYSQYGKTVRFLEWHDGTGYSQFGIDMQAEDAKLESEPWREFETSVPNIEVRLGALGLLERVYRSSPNDRSRILKLLGAYIQENSSVKVSERSAPRWVRSEEAVFSAEDNTALWNWTRQLRTRADVSMALAILATLRSINPIEDSFTASRNRPWGINLSDSALQAVSGAGLDLHGTRFQRSHLQGTDFKEANLKGANFIEAKMTFVRLSGADMREANCNKAILKGAIFKSTKMQGCDLSDSDVQGALFDGAQFDSATNFRGASNRGSALRSLDIGGAEVPIEFLTAAFGDSTVKGLPSGMRAGEGDLEHWAKDELEWSEFHRRWQIWQKEIGKVLGAK